MSPGRSLQRSDVRKCGDRKSLIRSPYKYPRMRFVEEISSWLCASSSLHGSLETIPTFQLLPGVCPSIKYVASLLLRKPIIALVSHSGNIATPFSEKIESLCMKPKRRPSDFSMLKVIPSLKYSIFSPCVEPPNLNIFSPLLIQSTTKLIRGIIHVSLPPLG